MPCERTWSWSTYAWRARSCLCQRHLLSPRLEHRNSFRVLFWRCLPSQRPDLEEEDLHVLTQNKNIVALQAVCIIWEMARKI
eukprot:2109459-Amphidinium_carterae.1